MEQLKEFLKNIDDVRFEPETSGMEQLLKDHHSKLKVIGEAQNSAINDNHSEIRKYGGTNDAEFFAVASEYFFERPGLLKKKHPELYQMLVKCFNQKLGL